MKLLITFKNAPKETEEKTDAVTLSPPQIQKKYGFYSKESDMLFGHVIWSKPDGSHVKVTNVTSYPNDEKGHQWLDAVCVGEVVNYVGSSQLFESIKFGKI